MEGSHSSSFGQAAKNQEILAKNLKSIEFKGEGTFTQSYRSLQQWPARSAVSCSAPHSPNAPWKYEGPQNSLWASPELICEFMDAGVWEEAEWQTSAKDLIEGISHSMCKSPTSGFYSQLLRDPSQGTEVLRTSVPMLARKHVSRLFYFSDLSRGFIALHPIKQFGTEVLRIPSSTYSFGDMIKIGCSYRLKRQRMENCWKVLI